MPRWRQFCSLVACQSPRWMRGCAGSPSGTQTCPSEPCGWCHSQLNKNKSYWFTHHSGTGQCYIRLSKEFLKTLKNDLEILSELPPISACWGPLCDRPLNWILQVVKIPLDSTLCILSKLSKAFSEIRSKAGFFALAPVSEVLRSIVILDLTFISWDHQDLCPKLKRKKFNTRKNLINLKIRIL